MKILSTIATKTIEVKNTILNIEIKKVVKSKVIVRSADKRAGTYTDNNYITTIAFVNGKNYIGCNDINTVIDELLSGGYKFFIN